ncbi:Uncharacterised protein [Mycobacterium tuberculosis]|uniref:Uncharacterized protein n=1 Tax=Mycobacterium tuberculosis TaxID=1773 RepID=A0A654U654_MYCTX|nr:Uncharacterised protein [Mycobacterium tuberculosis]CFS05954.1 Uncharacterised protein [Mycobacterium tuberculosis]
MVATDAGLPAALSCRITSDRRSRASVTMPGRAPRVVDPTPGTVTDTLAAVSGLPTATAASTC